MKVLWSAILRGSREVTTGKVVNSAACNNFTHGTKGISKHLAYAL